MTRLRRNCLKVIQSRITSLLRDGLSLSWPWLLVIIIIIIASVRPDNRSDHFRYAGLFLQIIGIMTVAIRLYDRRVLFNRPSFVARVLSWFHNLLHLFEKAKTVQLSGSARVQASSSLDMMVWRGTSNGQSNEERINALVANLETLKNEQSKILSRIQSETTKRSEAIDLERNQRESADREFQKRLEKLGAGGLHIEWAGVIWLIAGIVFATIPDEISSLFKWLLFRCA